MMPPVSVCHQLSWMGRWNASTPHVTACGLSGSPTLAMKRRSGNSRRRAASVPPFIIIRTAVGAVYHTLTRSASRIEYQRSASKSASSMMLVTPIVSGEMMP